MKWVNDVDPAADNYRNEPADKARVAHMAHKRLAGDDLTNVLAMLFQPPRMRNEIGGA